MFAVLEAKIHEHPSLLYAHSIAYQVKHDGVDLSLTAETSSSNVLRQIFM